MYSIRHIEIRPQSGQTDRKADPGDFHQLSVRRCHDQIAAQMSTGLISYGSLQPLMFDFKKLNEKYQSKANKILSFIG